MEDKNIYDWFFEEPIDFESKKYRLLSNVTTAEKMLEKGDIDEAMKFIEDHLVCFYKFQTEKEIVTHDSREIVGIDPILMNLIYRSKKQESNKEIEILSDIAELGILEFEALHSIFRIKWRDIDECLKLSYIPDKAPFCHAGFIFLSNHEENWTRFYNFENPQGCDDWTKFKIHFTDQYEYDYNKIMDFVNTLSKSGANNIVLNCSINKEFDSFPAIDFVLSCKVYYKLMKDYMF